MVTATDFRSQNSKLLNDLQVGGDPSSHIEKDPLNIDPLASATPSTSNNEPSSMSSLPMVSIAQTPRTLETELDLGSITDPNKEVKNQRENRTKVIHMRRIEKSHSLQIKNLQVDK